MGLDMYLEKRTYVGNKYRKQGGKKLTKVVIPADLKKDKSMFSLNELQDERIVGITEEVGYWRKANAIHQWFVDNVQGGNDDCKEYYVSQEKLKELLVLCNKVIKGSKLIKGKVKNGQRATKNDWEDVMEKGMIIENPKVAEELLPTAINGFFFGSTDYDQWYLEDIKETKKILTQALKEKHGEFYYQSSW